MKDILADITRLRLQRGWSEYDLAKNSGLTQSTISTWYRKNQTPTIKTLDKVCKGFGITLSQFFDEGGEAVSLTDDQREFDNRDKFIELGYNIAYYRKHAGLTQEQLAERVGISRQHLGAIEAPNLVRPISLELLFNIADVLDIPAYKLLRFRDEE